MVLLCRQQNVSVPLGPTDGHQLFNYQLTEQSRLHIMIGEQIWLNGGSLLTENLYCWFYINISGGGRELNLFVSHRSWASRDCFRGWGVWICAKPGNGRRRMEHLELVDSGEVGVGFPGSSIQVHSSYSLSPHSLQQELVGLRPLPTPTAARRVNITRARALMLAWSEREIVWATVLPP